ncbi:MAG: 6-pyruvoyl trahydropterin synthase family protein [Planctomycetaceae bacterium]
MFYLMQELDFCYGHRLLNYEGKCRNLHGHNGRLEILLGGEHLDSRGMLIDFGDIKRLLRTWVDESLDHKMLLSVDDPLLPVLQHHGQPVFVMQSNPTAENIARLIYEQGRQMGLPIQEVRLWETPRSSSSYRET